MLNWQNKILTKIISLILIQSFLSTGVVCPESVNNKDIADIYKIDSKLRVPMGFADKKSKVSGRVPLAERMTRTAGKKYPSKAFLLGISEKNMGRLEDIFKDVTWDNVEGKILQLANNNSFDTAVYMLICFYEKYRENRNGEHNNPDNQLIDRLIKMLVDLGGKDERVDIITARFMLPVSPHDDIDEAGELLVRNKTAGNSNRLIRIKSIMDDHRRIFKKVWSMAFNGVFFSDHVSKAAGIIYDSLRERELSPKDFEGNKYKKYLLRRLNETGIVSNREGKRIYASRALRLRLIKNVDAIKKMSLETLFIEQETIKEQLIEPLIPGRKFNWDSELVLSKEFEDRLGRGGANRLKRLNRSFNLLRSPVQKRKRPIFSKEKLNSATQNGFQLYKGDIIAKPSHDNVPGINLALIYSKNYMKISDYTRAFFMVHEFKHALGGSEQEAYKTMTQFLVRYGIDVARQIQADIRKEVRGVGRSGKNLILELVDDVIRQLEADPNISEQHLFGNMRVKGDIENLVKASSALANGSKYAHKYLASTLLPKDRHYVVGSNISFSGSHQAPYVNKQKTKKSIRQYIKNLIAVGLIGTVFYIGYHQFDASEAALDEFKNLGKPGIGTIYNEDKKGYNKQVSEIKELQLNDENKLNQKDAARIDKFLKGNRPQMIKFSAEKFNIEPELLAAFLYEEELYGRTHNRLAESIKEYQSKFFSQETAYVGTVGLGQISKKHFMSKYFLDYLYENRDYFLDIFESGSGRGRDLAMLQEFINFYKSWYDAVDPNYDAFMAHIENNRALCAGLAKIEEISIFFTALAVRQNADDIAARNAGVTVVPDMTLLRGYSRDWVVDEYKEIPKNQDQYGDLSKRYSRPFGNITYYHPLMRYFAVAQKYSGAILSYVRGQAKTKMYMLFLKSGKFKNQSNLARQSTKDASRAEGEIITPHDRDEIFGELMRNGKFFSAAVDGDGNVTGIKYYKKGKDGRSDYFDTAEFFKDFPELSDEGLDEENIRITAETALNNIYKSQRELKDAGIRHVWFVIDPGSNSQFEKEKYFNYKGAKFNAINFGRIPVLTFGSLLSAQINLEQYLVEKDGYLNDYYYFMQTLGHEMGAIYYDYSIGMKPEKSHERSLEWELGMTREAVKLGQLKDDERYRGNGAKSLVGVFNEENSINAANWPVIEHGKDSFEKGLDYLEVEKETAGTRILCGLRIAYEPATKMMHLMIGNADIAILEQDSDMENVEPDGNTKNMFYQKVGNKYLRTKPGKLYKAIAGTKDVFKFLTGLFPETKDDMCNARIESDIVYFDYSDDMYKGHDLPPKIKMNFVVKYKSGLKPFSFSPGDFIIYQSGSGNNSITVNRSSDSKVSETDDVLFIEAAKFIWYMSLTREGKPIPEGLPDNDMFLDSINSLEYWEGFGNKDLMSSGSIRDTLSGVDRPNDI
jgi:hypothetical protein